MKRRPMCRLVDLVWRIVPLVGLRSWLLDVHIDRCRDCQEQIADRNDCLQLLKEEEDSLPDNFLRELVIAESIFNISSLGLQKSPGSRKRGLFLRIYAVTAAMLIIVLLVGFSLFLIRGGQSDSSLAANDTIDTNFVSIVSVNYVLSRGRPADSFIYKTSDPEMVIIWVEVEN